MEVSGGSSEESQKIEMDIVRMHFLTQREAERSRNKSMEAQLKNFSLFPEPQGGI